MHNIDNLIEKYNRWKPAATVDETIVENLNVLENKIHQLRPGDIEACTRACEETLNYARRSGVEIYKTEAQKLVRQYIDRLKNEFNVNEETYRPLESGAHQLLQVYSLEKCIL